MTENTDNLRVGQTLFSKERSNLCVLFRSLKKNVAFFPFFRKERNVLFFGGGSHKSPKTRKKNGKERNVHFKERNVPNGKERGAQP